MSTINTSLSLVFSITKAQSIIQKKFDRLSVHGLGFSDFMILYLLEMDLNGQMRRIDLAGKMGLTASGVTRLLSPMEKVGLVKRKANERDARVSYVVLTATGKRVLNEAKLTAAHTAKEIFPGLKARDYKIIMEVLAGLGADFN